MEPGAKLALAMFLAFTPILIWMFNEHRAEQRKKNEELHQRPVKS